MPTKPATKLVYADDHPGISLPHCPMCGEVTKALYYADEAQGDRLVGLGLDMFLYCPGERLFWLRTSPYFSMRLIENEEWGFKVVRRRLPRQQRLAAGAGAVPLDEPEK